MRIVEDNLQRLRTEHAPGPLPGALLAAGIAIAIALTLLFERLPGVVVLLGGLLSVLLGVGAWTQSVRSRFEFDSDAARIRWWRRGWGWRRDGELSFDAVRQVVIQMGPGRRSGAARICLVTGQRIEPLARDFSLPRDQASQIAAGLRFRLRLEDADALETRVRQLLELGSEEEAIAALRRQQGLSTDQARELVRHLKES